MNAFIQFSIFFNFCKESSKKEKTTTNLLPSSKVVVIGKENQASSAELNSKASVGELETHDIMSEYGFFLYYSTNSLNNLSIL